MGLTLCIMLWYVYPHLPPSTSPSPPPDPILTSPQPPLCRRLTLPLPPPDTHTRHTPAQVAVGDASVDGFRVTLLDTCGLEDPEAGDSVNYMVSQGGGWGPC